MGIYLFDKNNKSKTTQIGQIYIIEKLHIILVIVLSWNEEYERKNMKNETKIKKWFKQEMDLDIQKNKARKQNNLEITNHGRIPFQIFTKQLKSKTKW